MTLYGAAIGQLLISTVFVFVLWLRVLIAAASIKDGSLTEKKTLFTSVALVIGSIGIFGMMTIRAFELYYGVSLINFVSVFYIVLSISYFLLVVAAAIGKSYSQIVAFIVVSLVWFTAYFYYTR